MTNPGSENPAGADAEEAGAPTQAADADFLEERLRAVAREKLLEEFLPRLETAVRSLSEEEVWRKPNPASNSVGNLVLHLEGNVRQWIVFGLGGAKDVRDRPREFAPRRREAAGEILRRLRSAVEEAVSVISGLRSADFARRVRIQAWEVDGVEIVIHVVEHFSYHYGQIAYAVKAVRGEDLGFYAGFALDGRPEADARTP